jgi:hypothetical protein
MTSAEGASSFKIADAYVLVGGKLDDKSVQAATRGAQQQISRTPMGLQVTLDKRSLNAAVTEVRAAVRDLSKDLKIKISVGLDDKSLADTALDVMAAADEMARRAPIAMKVQLDNRSVATADAELKAATRLMAQSDQVRLRVDGSGMRDADNEVQQFSNHWTRLIALVGAVGTIGSGPIEAAALGGLATGFVALGIASEAGDKRVVAALDDMKTAAKSTATDGFSPMVPAIQSVVEGATTQVRSLEGVFSNAALAVSPSFQKIGDDLVGAVSKGVSQSEPILQKLPPLADEIAQSFDGLEHSAVGFENNIDVGRAVQGWGALTGAVENILPPLALVFNTAAPLTNALINVAGSGVGTLFRELSLLNPVMEASGAVLNGLNPVISFLAPPVLALVLGTKLLTGSFTDVSGAGQKLKGFITNFPQNFQSLASTLGYTSKSMRDQAIEAAELTRDEALLQKQVLENVAAETEQAAVMSGSSKDALIAIQAKRELTAATEAASAAEGEFAAASEATAFSFGPLGIALGVIGAGIALFAGQSKDADPPVQDLTGDLQRLAAAAPGAADGVLNGNQALQDLVNKAKAAGVNVQSMLTAVSAGPSALKAFQSSVQDTENALGNQTTTLTRYTSAGKAGGEVAQTTSTTIKQLAESVAGNTDAYNALSAPQRKAVDQYNNLKSTTDSLGVSVGTLTNNQGANAAVTQTAAQQTQTWKNYLADAKNETTAFGGSLMNTQLQMANFAAASKDGTFNAEDFVKAQVTSAGAFQQAQQTYQQLKEAVTSTAQASAQASQQVSAAQHGEAQSALQVADAQHSAAQAEDQVAQAEHGVTVAARATADARAGVVTAIQQQMQANQQYVASQVAVKKAEQDVTQARKDAVTEMQNETRQVADQGDSMAEAELKLHDAQAAVTAAGLDNTKLKLSDLANQKNITADNEAQYQLLLALSEAQHNYNDTKAAQNTLDAQALADNKAGISGNKGVLTAQDQLTQAQQAQQQSQQQLASSKTGVIKASQAVTDAQYAEKQAHDAVTQAQYSARQAQLAVTEAAYSQRQAGLAVTQAVQGETTAQAAHKLAVQNASGSIDINTAAGNRNVTTLLSLYDNQIAAGKSTDQARTAVEKEGVALGITKGNVDKVLTSIRSVNGTTATFGVVGQPSVNLSSLINQAQQQGLNPHTLGFTPQQIGNARRDTPTGSSFREGGLFHGQGGPRDDANMIAISDKEFIVNAQATQNNLPMLHAINNGEIRGFADGGPTGDASSILRANIALTEVGAMFKATRAAYSRSGAAPGTLKDLPAKNPPVLLTGIDGLLSLAGGDTGAHGGAQAAAQAYAASSLGVHGWNSAQMVPLIKLWNQESNWEWWALNKSSGAYGIPQSLPATKMASAGADWRTNANTQINWGLGYIQDRYGSPAGAWAHEVSHNWYDEGGMLPQGLSLAMNGTGGGEHKAVFTDEQWAALMGLADRGSGGIQINHHWHGSPSDSTTALAQQVTSQTSWDLMTSVGG